MDPITNAAATGLTELTQYGLAGIFLMLLLAGGVWVLRYFMGEFKACKEENREFAEKLMQQNTSVIDKNTEAFHGVRLALTELKGKVENQ
tara:strand:+ start:2697 stop:2966 length:270 start_codon:yes stop_codon:yes gene_type:complete